MYSLRMSFWIVPRNRAGSTPRRRPHRLVQGEQDRGGGVDGHRGRDRARSIPSRRSSMSATLSIGTPTRPTSPAAIGSSQSYPIWVGRSKATRQAGLAALEEVAEAAVRLLGGPESRVLAHGPGPAAVPVGAHAAGEREALPGSPSCRAGSKPARSSGRRPARPRSPRWSERGAALVGMLGQCTDRRVARRRSPASSTEQQGAGGDGLSRPRRRARRRGRRAARGPRSASSSPRWSGATVPSSTSSPIRDRDRDDQARQGGGDVDRSVRGRAPPPRPRPGFAPASSDGDRDAAPVDRHPPLACPRPRPPPGGSGARSGCAPDPARGRPRRARRPAAGSTELAADADARVRHRRSRLAARLPRPRRHARARAAAGGRRGRLRGETRRPARRRRPARAALPSVSGGPLPSEPR